jgi:2-polyprenyl-3-methyl-5-hydroxy-6-metoxy-1,4-benzoquinol methylase
MTSRAMSRRRPDSVGRAALRLYRHEPVSARVHTWIRWLSCPFPQIAAVLPTSGRVLEIGCGHGLFAAYAALASPDRIVLGTDIDADKIENAQSAGGSLGDRLTFAVAVDGAVPIGPWDAIVIVDMLYLLPAPDQRALILEAAGRLAPGGVLVIKEMDVAPAWKARWNRTQEVLAVRVLRITDGGATMAFVPPGTMMSWLSTAGLSASSQRLDRRRLHPHHLLIAARDD